jgi:hypothetical protein
MYEICKSCNNCISYEEETNYPLSYFTAECKIKGARLHRNSCEDYENKYKRTRKTRNNHHE